MTNPTITQNSALYLLQHSMARHDPARPRVRWLAERINRVRDLRRRTLRTVIDVRRLHFGER
jgi:hypothetical protein